MSAPPTLLRALARRGLRSPLERVLATERKRIVDAQIPRYRDRCDALRAHIAAGDAGPRDELARLGRDALRELRGQLGAMSRRGALGSRLDRLWLDEQAVELIDRSDVAPARRRGVIETLDRWNRLSGSYDLFFDAVRPLLRRDGTTRVLELAAGQGGFALHVLRTARAEGLDLQVTATDLSEEHLEAARTEATAESLSLETRRLDALELAPSIAAADIVVCIQSLHHFDPGQVTVMFEAAARTAARGVVFVDGSRSALHAITLTSVGLLAFREPDFVHDGVMSLRRCYAPEELALLARLGSWGDGVESRWMPPSHCLLRLDTSTRPERSSVPAQGLED